MRTPADDWDKDERDVPPELARELARLDQPGPLPLEVLRAAGTGVLPADLERAAERHLATHPRAQATLDVLDDAVTLPPETAARLLERITGEAARDGASRRKDWGLTWQLAAGLGAFATAASLWWGLSRAEPQPEPAAPAAEARPAPETPAAPPAFLLPLERPQVRISLRAMTWRGAERANPALTALRAPLDAFRAGDYAAADREFSAIAGRFPELIEIKLYQGISRLFLDDVSGAVTSLRAAETIGDAAFANDVAWYLAVAEQRAGNIAAARARIEALCPAGAGDARACAVRGRLNP
jgi:hypothetical protein